MPLDRGNTNDSKYPWVMEKGFEKEVNVPRDFFFERWTRFLWIQKIKHMAI